MSASETTIRVLIAAEHSLFREAIRGVLAAEDDLQIVGEAKDRLQAETEAIRFCPDVAIVDTNLPNGDGIQATRRITMQVPTCRVIVMSGDESERLLIEALEAGASGFLSMASPIDDLIRATRAVHRGEALVPPPMLAGLLTTLIRRRGERDVAMWRLSNLTHREREVLALLAQGADNDRIAQRLVISPATARTHVQNALGKLEVHSRLEAAAFVVQNGLLDGLVGAER